MDRVRNYATLNKNQTLNDNYTFSLVDFKNQPYSQNVSLGENATFLCKGHGSYIHWFIDGDNMKNMTKEEKTDRRIVFIEEPVNHCTPPQSQCQLAKYACLFQSFTKLNHGIGWRLS